MYHGVGLLWNRVTMATSEERVEQLEQAQQAGPWRTRRLREAEKAATAPSLASPRADDRCDGSG